MTGGWDARFLWFCLVIVARQARSHARVRSALTHNEWGSKLAAPHLIRAMLLLRRTNKTLWEEFEKQSSATTYEEWVEYSRKLDEELEFELWKKNPKSQLYDYQLIELRLQDLRAARETKNWRKLLYLVRTTFSRNIGDINNPQLYQNSYCGTKRLIEEYIQECHIAIHSLLSCNEFEDDLLMNTLVQTRKAYGRTALVLSGGATLGLLHAGVLYELHRHKLLPKIISGSSAGSIFAALLCTHREDEYDELWRILDMPLNIFERTGQEESLLTRLKRFLKVGIWIDNCYLQEMLQGLLGETTTFQEAYNRNDRILNVTVSSASSHDMPRLLNYLTAPNVLIWSAVSASCSVPFVFANSTLMAKNPATGEIYPWAKASFIDGSVDNDLPLDRLAEMFNVNYFIACQVNPHVAPLLHLSERWAKPIVKAPKHMKAGLDDTEMVPDDFRTIPSWFKWGKSILLNELGHALDLLDQVGVLQTMTKKLANLMDQEYIGNVTVLPRLEISDFVHLLHNPTPKISYAAMMRGRKATWPKLAIIHNSCAIEVALDRAVYSLRGRIIGSSTTKAVRAKPKGVSRRLSDGTLRTISSSKDRWSSTDLNKVLAQSPSQLRASNSISRSQIAAIRHSYSLNSQLNELLRDSVTLKNSSSMKYPARFTSGTPSPTLTRDNSFSNLAGVTGHKGRSVSISVPGSINSESGANSPVMPSLDRGYDREKERERLLGHRYSRAKGLNGYSNDQNFVSANILSCPSSPEKEFRRDKRDLDDTPRQVI